VGIAMNKKGKCPVFGKNCNKSNKKNHFSAKCRSKLMLRSVKALAKNDEEVFQLGKTVFNRSQSSWKVETIYVFR